MKKKRIILLQSGRNKPFMCCLDLSYSRFFNVPIFNFTAHLQIKNSIHFHIGLKKSHIRLSWRRVPGRVKRKRIIPILLRVIAYSWVVARWLKWFLNCANLPIQRIKHEISVERKTEKFVLKVFYWSLCFVVIARCILDFSCSSNLFRIM